MCQCELFLNPQKRKETWNANSAFETSKNIDLSAQNDLYLETCCREEQISLRVCKGGTQNNVENHWLRALRCLRYC